MSTDTPMDRLRAANPAPDTRLLRAESEDLGVLLATIRQRSTNMQTTQPQGAEPSQRQGRRGWVIAVAAFALVIAVGLTAALLSSRSTDGEPATVVVPTTTVAPAAIVAPTTTQATTTTTQPATTTTTLPFIRTGTYSVPDEVAPGTYRVWGNAATRLDENMELIGLYLAAVPGFAMMIVQPTDSFVSVGDWIITVEDFGRPIDPVAEGLIDGVYLVGYDLEPGRYEVLPGDHPEDPYWARLDDELEIIDSGTGVGIQEVIVEASDFALKFKGSLRLIP